MATGVELATAYVSLVPSTRGIAGQVAKEVGAPLEKVSGDAGRRGGESFGRNLATNAAAGVDRLGGSIVDGVQRWVGRAAMVGAGILATGLFGGLNRVLDTEDAQTAFRQMGLSVNEVEKAMKGVDRTFDGTPFANPAGFNITAQLLASGRGLNQVENDLKNIANVTSQTLDKDLDRTSQTFLRVAATGRAYATDLNMLALQGLPIRNILADGLNVSADALTEMVANGEITFDVLMDIIGATERFDGAAQAMGSTTRGAFSNVMTGVARLGESFLGPLFGENGHAVQALQGIRGAMRDLTPVADDIGKRFAEWLIPAIGRVSDWFSNKLVPAIKSAGEWFAEHRDTIARVVRAIAPAAAAVGGLAAAFNVVRRVIALTPIGLVFTLATALVYAYQNSEAFRDIIDTAFTVALAVIKPVAEIVGTALVRAFDALVEVGGFVERNWGLIGPIFKTLAATIGVLLIPMWVRMAAVAAVSAAKNVAAWAAGRIAAVRSAAVQVAQSARVVAGWVRQGVAAAAQAARVAAAWVASQAPAMRAAAVQAAQAARVVAGWVLMGTQSLLRAAQVAAAWLIAMGPIAIVIAAVVAVVGIIIANFDTIKRTIAGAWNWIKDSAAKVWNWITDRISGFVNWLGSVPGTIRAKFGDAFYFLRQQATNAVNWVRDRFDNVISFFTGLPGRITWAVWGMFDGIKTAFRGALNFVIDRWNSLSFKLPSFGGFSVMGKTVIPAFTGPTLRVPQLPRFHTGGIVPGRTGEDVLAIVAAGETILPTHDPTWSPQGDGGGDVVVKIGDDELVRIIRKADRKRGGRLLAGGV